MGNEFDIWDVNLAVARLITYKDDCALTIATGFFFRSNGKVFLITNKHCIINEEKDFFPNKIKFEVHLDPKSEQKLTTNNIGKFDFKWIDLYNKKNEPKWLEHPDNKKLSREKQIDIVAIEIDEKIMRKCVFRVFGEKHFPPEDLQLILGTDLLVLGYPMDFFDTKNRLPLARTATISSEYNFGFNDEKCFLIDSHLHHGMSGSPVITKPLMVETRKKENKRILFSGRYYLLGIHSAGQEYLGLNKVWYIELLKDIIKQ